MNFLALKSKKKGGGRLPYVSTSPSMAKNSVTVPKSVVDDLVEEIIIIWHLLEYLQDARGCIV